MPINSKHPDYDSSKATITKDAYDGNVGGYIPRLKGQTNEEYAAYVSRATYFNVTRRTCAALVGAMLRKPFTSSIDVEDINICDGVSFDQFAAESLQTLMYAGRMGVLVDYDEDKQAPYIIPYTSNNIINWRSQHEMLTMVVLEENSYQPKETDAYEVELVVKYRELLMIDGQYNVRIWEQQSNKSYTVVDAYVPTFRGRALDYIPFAFINAIDTSPKVAEPVLYNMADINISHFRTSADIEHSAHFTALPQPWISGDLQEDQTELPIGTFSVWQLEADAKVGYLEFAGNGIGKLQDIAKHKEEQMSAIGSRLLQDKKGVESVEALRIRAGAESATLVTVAQAFEGAMAQILKFYQYWLGSDMDVDFGMNKDFSSAHLTPQELKSLMDAYIAGTISQDTFLQNLYLGELIDSVEDEQARLDTK